MYTAVLASISNKICDHIYSVPGKVLKGVQGTKALVQVQWLRLILGEMLPREGEMVVWV